jgi:hypothetical protein
MKKEGESSTREMERVREDGLRMVKTKKKTKRRG